MLYAYNAAKGQKLWSANTVNRVEFGSPMIINGIVYAVGNDGQLYVSSLRFTGSPAEMVLSYTEASTKC